MPFTEAEREAYAEDKRRQEEAQESFVRKLIDFVGAWQDCENRACRRARTCAAPRACGEKYADEILRFQREYYVPYLRVRYPSVQWGAPASVVEAQYEAALEAEREEEARLQGRAPTTQSDSASAASRRRKKKRAVQHALYDPGDV